MTAVAAARAVLASCEEVSVVHGRGPGAVEALRAVTLDVGESDRVALWGRSGSGKTTLLHVLGGLVEPTAGVARWRGRPLVPPAVRDRGGTGRPSLAFVFQSPALLAHFTAFENVAFAQRHSGALTGRAPSVEELLTLLGLAGKLDALPDELSGGEAQRAAIARALAGAPALLLCDEPTGHLDSDTAGRVLDVIDALQARFGFALVVATHDADVAARYDRLLELADGRIACQEAAA